MCQILYIDYLTKILSSFIDFNFCQTVGYCSIFREMGDNITL